MLDELASRCSYPRRGPVACAVSGGPDSCALLVLACHLGIDVTAHHVDHGLRADSADEADVVRDLAASFGAGFVGVSAPVADGPNLEARARAARYAALPPGVLTGHTADDQAETVLLHLLRGAGLDGVSGMGPERRPLLALRRRETHALCHHLGITTVDDPSNRDPRHRRNRVRDEVIPLLCEVADRDVVPLLARTAAIARDDIDHLDALAAVIDARDVAALRSVPRALARRAIRRLLTEEHPPDAATVQRVLDVVDGTYRATEVGGGRTVRRSQGRLVLDDARVRHPPGPAA